MEFSEAEDIMADRRSERWIAGCLSLSPLLRCGDTTCGEGRLFCGPSRQSGGVTMILAADTLPKSSLIQLSTRRTILGTWD